MFPERRCLLPGRRADVRPPGSWLGELTMGLTSREGTLGPQVGACPTARPSAQPCSHRRRCGQPFPRCLAQDWGRPCRRQTAAEATGCALVLRAGLAVLGRAGFGHQGTSWCLFSCKELCFRVSVRCLLRLGTSGCCQHSSSQLLPFTLIVNAPRTGICVDLQFSCKQRLKFPKSRRPPSASTGVRLCVHVRRHEQVMHGAAPRACMCLSRPRGATLCRA